MSIWNWIEPWIPPADSAQDAKSWVKIEVPADVQARFDALPEETKAELAREVDKIWDGLYAAFGVTRHR